MEEQGELTKLYAVKQMMEEEDKKFDLVTDRLNSISMKFNQGNDTLHGTAIIRIRKQN